MNKLVKNTCLILGISGQDGSYLADYLLKSKKLKVHGMIRHNSSMKNIEKWDSLNHIGLINEIEEKFNLQFNDEDIVKMINFKIIINKIINIKRKNN